MEKRVYEESLEDQDGGMPNLKKPKVPGLARFVEVQILCIQVFSRLNFLFPFMGIAPIVLFSILLEFTVLKVLIFAGYGEY